MNLRTAARLCGVNYRTAARWLESGLLRPVGYDPKKWRQGLPIPWTGKETRELRTLAELRGVLSLQALRRAGEFLRKHLAQNPYSSGRFLVVDGPPNKRELVKICDTGEAIRLLQEPGQVLLFRFAQPDGGET